MRKIIYNIINNKEIEEGLFSSMFSKEILFQNIQIFQSPAIDITMTTVALNEDIEIVQDYEIRERIKEAVNCNQKEAIILNGYDISVDHLKNTFVELADELNITIVMNVPSEDTAEYGIIIDCSLASSFLEEEWSELRQKITDLSNDNKDKETEDKQVDTNNQFCFNDIIGNIDLSKMKNLDDMEDMTDYIKKYQTTTDVSHLEVREYKETVSISDGIEEALILKEDIDFLILALTKIKENQNV